MRIAALQSGHQQATALVFWGATRNNKPAAEKYKSSYELQLPRKGSSSPQAAQQNPSGSVEPRGISEIGLQQFSGQRLQARTAETRLWDFGCPWHLAMNLSTYKVQVKLVHASSEHDSLHRTQQDDNKDSPDAEGWTL